MEHWDLYWNKRVLTNDDKVILTEETDTGGTLKKTLSLERGGYLTIQVNRSDTSAMDLSDIIDALENAGFTGRYAPERITRKPEIPVSDLSNVYTVELLTTSTE
jgi:hypothetical protein